MDDKMGGTPPTDCPMDADAIIHELLGESERTGAPIAESADDACIRELLQRASHQMGGSKSNPPIDLSRLKAMLGGMLQHTAASTKPADTREALREKLRKKQQARRSKHAIQAYTEKTTKSAAQPDSTATAPTTTTT